MGNRWYIVDYDIPVSPARERVQFYRDMETLHREYGSGSDYSTLSVFRTQDRALAQAVYLLVVAHYGSAHVYSGEEITQTIAVQLATME